MAEQEEAGALLPTGEQPRSLQLRREAAALLSRGWPHVRVGVPLLGLLVLAIASRPAASPHGLRSSAQGVIGLAGDCHTAVEGESCYVDAMWAKTDGIYAHPKWYPGLTADSSAAEFQASVHLATPEKCPQPCGVAPAQPAQADSSFHVARWAPPGDDLREQCGLIEDGVDYNVSAFETLYDVGSEHMCCSACAAYPRCKAWTWGKERDADWVTNVCWLKEDPAAGDMPRVSRASVVSGRPSPGVVKYGVLPTPASQSRLMDGVTPASAGGYQQAGTKKCPGKLAVRGYGDVSLISAGADTPGQDAGLIQVEQGDLLVPHMTGRAYFGEACTEGAYARSDYAAINFLGKRISWMTDVSGLGCGCNAAVYLVSMRQNPNISTCNDYYCDAMKVCGVACTEIDLQEANMYSWMSTMHAYNTEFGADTLGVARGYGGSIGEPPRRDWTADQYGPGARCVDTSMPFRVSVSFPVDSLGNLAGMQLQLSQQGKSCVLEASIDAYPRKHHAMAEFTQALSQGMTPVVSYWKSKDMLWMDGLGYDGRGPCVKDAPDTCPDHVRSFDFSIEALDAAR